MKTVVLLFDTLIKKHLPIYGGNEISTPNIDRISMKSTKFNQHWVGSAPCVPARRDMFTGRMEFLERPWGPMEPFDKILAEQLSQAGIFTHMITDHYHYFERSAQQYYQSFDTWDFIRGQENDTWKSNGIQRSGVYPLQDNYDEYIKKLENEGIKKEYGVYQSQYTSNKSSFELIGRPLENTVDSACDWLNQNGRQDDYFLWVECFDPHEPFDVPEKYYKTVEKDMGGIDFKWPSYAKVTEPPEAIEKLRKNYLANLLYVDDQLGRILDVFDDLELWNDTMIIFTSDHGHMLGEHNFTGKNVMPMYNEISQIPLLIHLPGETKCATEINVLSQSMDIYSTVLDYHKVNFTHKVHSDSLLPLIRGEKESNRECALFGVFGGDVNVTDGKHVYMKSHVFPDNQPLFLYTGSPFHFLHDKSPVEQANVITKPFLTQTDMPIYQIPVKELWMNERRLEYCNSDRLFDNSNNERQEKELQNIELEESMKKKLIDCMKLYNAPEEQFVRLGL